MTILRHEHRRQESMPLLQDFTRSICEDVRELLRLYPLFLVRMTLGGDGEARVVGRYFALADRMVSLFPIAASSSGGTKERDSAATGFGARRKLQKALGKLFILWNHRKRMRDERSKPP